MGVEILIVGLLGILLTVIKVLVVAVEILNWNRLWFAHYKSYKLYICIVHLSIIRLNTSWQIFNINPIIPCLDDWLWNFTLYSLLTVIPCQFTCCIKVSSSPDALFKSKYCKVLWIAKIHLVFRRFKFQWMVSILKFPFWRVIYYELMKAKRHLKYNQLNPFQRTTVDI